MATSAIRRSHGPSLLTVRRPCRAGVGPTLAELASQVRNPIVTRGDMLLLLPADPDRGGHELAVAHRRRDLSPSVHEVLPQGRDLIQNPLSDVAVGKARKLVFHVLAGGQVFQLAASLRVGLVEVDVRIADVDLKAPKREAKREVVISIVGA